MGFSFYRAVIIAFLLIEGWLCLQSKRITMTRKKNAVAYKFRIGNNIRKWRNIKDVKQKDLAIALNLSEAAVSNIENDVTNITVTQLEDIAIALNVSIEQLLSDPQERFRMPIALAQEPPARDQQEPIDKDLLNAVIASLEKKDQQMQVIMQNFLHAFSTLMQQENHLFNASKQVASRA